MMSLSDAARLLPQVSYGTRGHRETCFGRWWLKRWGPPGCLNNVGTVSGWWFQTCFIFPNSWDDDPIWLYIFFQRGWNHRPVFFVLALKVFHRYLYKLCLFVPSRFLVARWGHVGRKTRLNWKLKSSKWPSDYRYTGLVYPSQIAINPNI